MDKAALKAGSAVATPNSWSDIMTEKLAKFFEKEHVQYAIRNKILDPILNYILNKIFPYIMLICVMFMLLLVSVIVTLCVMIFKFRGPPTSFAAPGLVEKEIAL